MGKDDFPVSGCAVWVGGEVSSGNKEDAEGDTSLRETLLKTLWKKKIKIKTLWDQNSIL